MMGVGLGSYLTERLARRNRLAALALLSFERFTISS
jgi:hypothetical protein